MAYIILRISLSYWDFCPKDNVFLWIDYQFSFKSFFPYLFLFLFVLFILLFSAGHLSLYIFQYCSILWFYFSFISSALTLQISNHLFFCDLSWLLLWVLKNSYWIIALCFYRGNYIHSYFLILFHGNISKSILFFPMCSFFHYSVLLLKIYLLCWPLLKSIHFGVR